MSASLLELQGVTHRFDGLHALSEVSFAFDAGERYSIIGPNGAGKSTLANVICGTIRPSDGRVRLSGTDITGKSPDRIARLGVARKFQVPSLFARLTVIENLRLAAESPAARQGANEQSKAASLERILWLTGLEDVTSTRAEELPHGHKQWLEIGMTLLTGPKLLVLDEPSAGMGVDETMSTAQMIGALRGETTVIVIEHDMRFVAEVGGQVIVLNRGALLCTGSFDEVRASKAVQDLYLGAAST